MAKIGFGTMEYAEKEVGEMEGIITNAIKVGYRRFDTAEIYASAEFLGKALKNSNIDRKEFHITSKIKGLPTGTYEELKTRIQKHLNVLQLDYIDLLLVHSPTDNNVDFGGSPETIITTYPLGWFKEHIKAAWSHMSHLKADGYVKEIGVSNFYQPHLEILLAEGGEKPYANEIFIDAAHPEQQLVEFLKTNGIVPIAYRPLVFLPSIQLASEMGSGFYAQIEAAAASFSPSISPAMFVLAWLLSRGIDVMVKASSEEKMKMNLEAAELLSANNNNNAALTLEGCSEEDLELIEMSGGVDEYALAFKAIIM